MADATFAVQLPEEIDKLLEALSKSTDRSKSVLAIEAITLFVQSEAQIVESIKRGMEDGRNGRVVPHAEAMRQIRATIDRVASEQRYV